MTGKQIDGIQVPDTPPYEVVKFFAQEDPKLLDQVWFKVHIKWGGQKIYHVACYRCDPPQVPHVKLREKHFNLSPGRMYFMLVGACSRCQAIHWSGRNT